MNQIQERLSRLRLYMKTFNIDLCIVPTADYHQSEYVAEHFKYRAYLSGLSGSAGTLAVSADQAKLWTDSRYFLQAEQQLAGSGIELMKMRTENYPSLHEWIASENFQHIGIDG
jgi:Xaa-Pro aminopeptidase